MRQAIVTRYLGPTDHRGSRIVVRAQAGRMTVSLDHALDVAENHERAAKIYANERGWLTAGYGARLVGGSMPDDTGYCFVLVPLGPSDNV